MTGEWGMGNGEWGMENGEWRIENGELRIENGELRIENGELRMGETENSPFERSYEINQCVSFACGRNGGRGMLIVGDCRGEPVCSPNEDDEEDDEVQIPASEENKEITPFKPNPKTAYLTALIFPGVGQIYNRQYWKLPIVYGGLMGCAYAISWNNKTYQDYKGAYFAIKKDAEDDPHAENPDSWSDKWQVFFPSYIDPATRLHNSSFHSQLKRGKDYFRRYRDLSIIVTIAVYLISVADAYVDAQMFDFDVSPDLSFRVTPVFTPETLYRSKMYGFNLTMNF